MQATDGSHAIQIAILIGDQRAPGCIGPSIDTSSESVQNGKVSAGIQLVDRSAAVVVTVVAIAGSVGYAVEISRSITVQSAGGEAAVRLALEGIEDGICLR